MEQIEWSEVIEYLEANPDKMFNYNNVGIRSGEDDCYCLMGSFFKERFGPEAYTNFLGNAGFKPTGSIDDRVANIVNMPFSRIGEVHQGRQSGAEILKRIKDLT